MTANDSKTEQVASERRQSLAFAAHQPLRITIVTDLSGHEAMYVDGVFRMSESTIYASEIDMVADRRPMVLETECIEFCHNPEGDGVEWPKSLLEALQNPNPDE